MSLLFRLRQVLLLLLIMSLLMNIVLFTRLNDLGINLATMGGTSKQLSFAGNGRGAEQPRTLPYSAMEGSLSCEAYGGPSNADALADMVYWRDFPENQQFRSVYNRDGSKPYYFVFEPDEAGFSNVRLSFETVVAFATAMGRTLVMLPKFRFSQLLYPHPEGVRSYSFLDFFDVRNVPMISMQEYLETVALKGQLKNQQGVVQFPPDNRSDWNGAFGNSGNANSGEADRFFNWLSRAMNSINWKRDSCVVAFPADLKNGITAVRPMVKSILKKEKDDAESRIQEYTGNPTPVDSVAFDRFREMLSERDTLCEYDSFWEKSESLYMTGHERTGSRPLIPFYAYLYFEEWHQDLQMKRFMRDNLRFSDNIQCAAARIVEAMRNIAKHAATDGSNPNGNFDTMHVRRTDFKDLATYKEGTDSAQQIVDDKYFDENRTIYIATDEKDKTFFDPIRKQHTVLFLHDFDHLIKGVDPNFFGMIEQLVCAKGDKFVGTYYSTFTAYINRVKGYHTQKSQTEDALKGILNSEYMGHKGSYRYSLKQYRSARKDFWSREWPIAWRDIDHDVPYS